MVLNQHLWILFMHQETAEFNIQLCGQYIIFFHQPSLFYWKIITIIENICWDVHLPYVTYLNPIFQFKIHFSVGTNCTVIVTKLHRKVGGDYWIKNEQRLVQDLWSR